MAPILGREAEDSRKDGKVRNGYKNQLHRDLINKVDVQNLLRFDAETGRREVARILKTLVEDHRFPLTLIEKKELIDEVVNETFGLGPLEPLMADPTVNDILVNRFNLVYVERAGMIETTDVQFQDERHLRHIINRIVARVGRRIDEASPMVDARLPDGSRVNAIIPPLALDGSALSIRRFRKNPITAAQMIEYGTLNREILVLLEIAIKTRLNVLISGGTGSGKTTILNMLSQYIPENERIVTIEDAAELQLRQPHVVRLETRPANIEGLGQVSQRDLFRNCLRMRPDRIIVGEVRGGEALDMLQAMNTGHDGSLTTVHANTPRDALMRIETMILMGSTNLTQEATHRQIASAIHLIVQIKRFSDGVRRISSISEITGMEGNVITSQEVASYTQKGTAPGGKCIGNFEFRPIKPRFIDEAKARGVDLSQLSAHKTWSNSSGGDKPKGILR